MHHVCKDKNIHYYDCRRGERWISYWGLEGRDPLLGPDVIEAYWKLPAEWRHPKYKGVEKWWLRKAFDGLDLLPKEVLWRMKEGMSDGVSSQNRGWYQIIQEYTEKMYECMYGDEPWEKYKEKIRDKILIKEMISILYFENESICLPLTKI